MVVGVDVGGSHIGFGLIDPLTCSPMCTRQVKVQALSSVSDLISLLATTIEDMLRTNSAELISVGVGVPGQCIDGVLIAAANILPGHNNIPISVLLGRALKTTVVLVNDADAYLAAEVLSLRFKEKYGNIKSAAMITLGTGVGFSLYLNGQLFEGSHGMLEGGHMIVCDKDGELCGCGQKGCVEMYASAHQTALRYLSRSNMSSSDGNITHAEARDVFVAAAEGNEVAQQVLNETADYLAILCVNICRVVDPEMIIFGGGMSAAGEILLELIREHIRRRTWTILPTDIRLVTCESRQEVAGIVGAGLAALQAVTKNQKIVESSDPVKSSTTTDVKPSWSISDMITVPRYQLLGFLSLAFIAGGLASGLGIKRFFGCTRLRK